MRTFTIFTTIIFLVWLEGFLEGLLKFDYEISDINGVFILLFISIFVAMAQDIKELIK